MKKLCILGSTGSIGKQAAAVVRASKNLNIVALAAGSNVVEMEKQIREFKPKLVAMEDQKAANALKLMVADTETKVLSGSEGVVEVASSTGWQMALCAIVGFAALKPLVAAIKEQKDIALANKEAMVVAGHIINRLATENKTKIFPVDSEHCAIFQALGGKRNSKAVKKIILTASGGPFINKTTEQLKNVTLNQALKHPNWSMGKKITIDSATLMNKALEIIEAYFLFKTENIEVVVHKESIIHSMVEFKDNSILAQMGVPDLKLPISYALNYGKRVESIAPSLSIADVGSLSFKKPDVSVFKALGFAYEALKSGGSMFAVMNGANEAAVKSFMEGKCGFLDIVELTGQAMANHSPIKKPNLEQIRQADLWARSFVLQRI